MTYRVKFFGRLAPQVIAGKGNKVRTALFEKNAYVCICLKLHGLRVQRGPYGLRSTAYSLHAAARAVGLDSEGFGPHTFRRANIIWRQQVGGSAIEASRIAGRWQGQMPASQA